MRGAPFTLALAAALLLAGCAGPAPDPDATTGATSTVPETTAAAKPEALEGDVALQVVIDTYLEYMATIGTVLDQGHDDEGLLDALTTGDVRAENPEIIRNAQSEDWEASGRPAVVDSLLVSVVQDAGLTTIVADLCLDRSEMVLLHEDGTPALGENSLSVIPIRVTVDSTGGQHLVSKTAFGGADLVCNHA